MMKLDPTKTLKDLGMATETSNAITSIVVVSGRGGVGKSTAALNIAMTLGRFGKRVLLLDADVDGGSLDILAGVSPRFTLGDMLRQDLEIAGSIERLSPQVDLIAAGCVDMRLAQASNDELDCLFSAADRFARNYDVLLIDCGTGAGERVRTTVMHADQVIVVATPEPAVLTSSYAVIRELTARCQPKGISILMTQVADAQEATAAFRKIASMCSKFLEIEPQYLGAVPFDPGIKQAAMAQVPIVSRYPKAPSARAFEAIAAGMIGIRLAPKGFGATLLEMFLRSPRRLDAMMGG